MLFQKIIGQTDVKKKLITMVREGRISHALLLLGQEGSGALPLALAFSSYVLCQQKKENDSCSECPACQKTARLIHPDLHVVFPVAKTKEVDEIRQATISLSAA
jgi:DNA polymerase III subunit delta'